VTEHGRHRRTARHAREPQRAARGRIKRLARSGDKLDAYLAEQMERQRRIEQEETRTRSQINDAVNRETQTRFDSVLEQFGQRMGAPEAGQDPIAYQRQAMVKHKTKLARADERPIDRYGTTVGQVAEVTIKQLPDSLLDNHERDLIAASHMQADAPHHDTLPPAGEFTTIVKTDSTNGMKKVCHYGKESFIKALTRAGRRVERIVDPVNKLVIWGKPFSRV
jgi:hypothetical protein